MLTWCVVGITQNGWYEVKRYDKSFGKLITKMKSNNSVCVNLHFNENEQKIAYKQLSDYMRHAT